MTNNRLEFLIFQKNRLIDIWKSKKYEHEETKILVKIMDLDEEIADEMRALKKKQERCLAI